MVWCTLFSECPNLHDTTLNFSIFTSDFGLRFNSQTTTALTGLRWQVFLDLKEISGVRTDWPAEYVSKTLLESAHMTFLVLISTVSCDGLDVDEEFELGVVVLAFDDVDVDEVDGRADELLWPDCSFAVHFGILSNPVNIGENGIR